MKKHLSFPAALFALALALSGCVWYGPGGYHHGGYYGGGGWDHPHGDGDGWDHH